MEPLVPRITKSTAIAAIKARFETTEELLKRFEVAKNQANLWDGERDGLREAVKTLDGGKYGNTVLSWSSTAAVMYPNADGKHQLENCLQTTIPIPKFQRGNDDTGMLAGDELIAFRADGVASPEEFLDAVLHQLQKGKPEALDYLKTLFVGAGTLVDNTTLYEKKGADKSTITVLPEV